MPSDRHDAFDADRVSTSRPFARQAQLTRRDLLGGIVCGTALGVASPALAGTREGVAPAARAVRRGTAVLRLGSNENPTGLGPAARQAFLAAADEANRYPGRGGSALVESLAKLHKVEPSWIHVAPGSGELLRAATVAFTSPTRSLVVAAPTFEAPARVATAIGAPVQAVPVTAEGRLDLTAMAAKASGAGLFFVCNPNNPTGSHVTASAVSDFVAAVRAAAPDARILVDEAYFEYVDDPAYASAVPLAIADKRVFVTRTFSKVFGMAGLRVGYAVAHPDTIAALRKEGSSGTLTGASMAAAAAALADTATIAAEVERNRAARRYTREKFEAAGYRVLPSSANFVMIDIKRDAGAFQALCRQHQLLVARPFPPLTSCVRLSVGTMAEMEDAVPAMLAMLDAPPPASARVEPAGLDWMAGGAC